MAPAGVGACAISGSDFSAIHWPDFFIILVLLPANAGIGFWEEHQAGKAIAAMKAELAIKARVRRDGKWITPPSRELVPGDVVRLLLLAGP